MKKRESLSEGRSSEISNRRYATANIDLQFAIAGNVRWKIPDVAAGQKWLRYRGWLKANRYWRLRIGNR
jgi:hypothetical protein